MTNSISAKIQFYNKFSYQKICNKPKVRVQDGCVEKLINYFENLSSDKSCNLFGMKDESIDNENILNKLDYKNVCDEKINCASRVGKMSICTISDVYSYMSHITDRNSTANGNELAENAINGICLSGASIQDTIHPKKQSFPKKTNSIQIISPELNGDAIIRDNKNVQPKNACEMSIINAKRVSFNLEKNRIFYYDDPVYSVETVRKFIEIHGSPWEYEEDEN